MKSLLDRIKEQCRVDPATDCWTWRGFLNEQGYPQFRVATFSNQPILGRRLVYELAVGKLTGHHVVVSTCGDKDCLNPLHLKKLTRAQMAKKILIHVNEGLTHERRKQIAAKRRGKQLVATWHP